MCYLRWWEGVRFFRQSRDLLVSCWDCDEVAQGILLGQEIDTQLPQIVTRYLCVPGGWCPSG